MTFRTYEDSMIYVIGAPAGSKFLLDDEGNGELILFETMTNGTTIERRLPTAIVVKAAHRGCFGLKIVERRRPAHHPEVADAVSRS